MIEIYGCSDDLIEIEGDINEEFDVYNETPTYLLFSNGMIIKVDYDGDWTFNIIKQGAPGSCVVKIEPFSQERSYSQTVIIDNHNVSWICLSDRIAVLGKSRF